MLERRNETTEAIEVDPAIMRAMTASVDDAAPNIARDLVREAARMRRAANRCPSYCSNSTALSRNSTP